MRYNLTHGSTFSGIGGFDYPAELMGWTNVFQVEKDPHCNKILNKNFKNTARYEDITTFDARKYKGKIDVFTGGFPCQPFSLSGERKGEDDERFLWDEKLRVIREVQPLFIVAENVTGILSMEGGQTFEKICLDLESEGYAVQPIIVPACAKGAWHERNRVWFLAYSTSNLLQRISEGYFKNVSVPGQPCDEECPHIPKPQHVRLGNYRGIRKYDGLSKRVDRRRMKGLGNAIVPHIAHEIFKSIEEFIYLQIKTSNT